VEGAKTMSVELIVVVLLILLLLGSGPWYPYNRTWGYRPFGGLAVVLLVLLLLFLLGGNRLRP
jgi:Protein of unknown function (DUF3309)